MSMDTCIIQFIVLDKVQTRLHGTAKIPKLLKKSNLRDFYSLTNFILMGREPYPGPPPAYSLPPALEEH